MSTINLSTNGLIVDGGSTLDSQHLAKLLTALVIASLSDVQYASNSQLFNVAIDEQNSRITWYDRNIASGSAIQSVNYDAGLLHLLNRVINATQQTGLTLQQLLSALADQTTALTSTLANKSDLAGLATTNDLSGLATAADLSGLAKTSELTDLAKTSDVTGASQAIISSIPTIEQIKAEMFTAAQREQIVTMASDFMAGHSEIEAFNALGHAVSALQSTLNQQVLPAIGVTQDDDTLLKRLLVLQASVAWLALPETAAGSGRTRGFLSFVHQYVEERTPLAGQDDSLLRVYHSDARQKYIAKMRPHRVPRKEVEG